MSRKKVNHYRVVRIDESYCFIDATSEAEAIELSNDPDANWNVIIGDTEIDKVEQ